MTDVFKTPNGRLREAGANRIHDLADGGMTYQNIAKELRVSKGTVYNVVNGLTWEFVKAERDSKREVSP